MLMTSAALRLGCSIFYSLLVTKIVLTFVYTRTTLYLQLPIYLEMFLF